MGVRYQQTGRVGRWSTRCRTASGYLGRKSREGQRGQQRQRQQTDQAHYMASAKGAEERNTQGRPSWTPNQGAGTRPARTTRGPPTGRPAMGEEGFEPRHPACKAGALDQLSYSPE